MESLATLNLKIFKNYPLTHNLNKQNLNLLNYDIKPQNNFFFVNLLMLNKSF